MCQSSLYFSKIKVAISYNSPSINFKQLAGRYSSGIPSLTADTTLSIADMQFEGGYHSVASTCTQFDSMNNRFSGYPLVYIDAYLPTFSNI